MTLSRQQSCRTSPDEISTAAPHPHTPIGGGGGAVGVPYLPNLCRTSGAASAADQTVPLAALLAERAKRQKAEKERDQERREKLAVQDTLGQVLQGIKERDEAGR